MNDNEQRVATEDKMRSEIDTVPWSALVRHFAFGRVYEVQPGWSLLEAAVAVHSDHKDLIKSAMENGVFGPVKDDDARIYQAEDSAFDVLVIDPFVIVQKRV